MLFALDIFVNKKAPPIHSVHWGLNSTSTPSFLSSPFLNLQTIQAGAQRDIFQGRGGFVELGHFDKSFIKNTIKKCPVG